jgi:phosphoribosylaminoimidazole-succinocarboxamide synthase
LATSPATVFETALRGLPLVHRGKVRDIYAVGADHLLIVTTDRLSAFDVVLPDPIPGKGRVLQQISEFWFRETHKIIPNQLSDLPLESAVSDPAELALLRGRAAIVRRLKALPIEAVVRGYLIGSGFKDYQRSGAVCGIALPQGLGLAAQLPEALFTPATKAAVGEHDENIPYAECERLLGTQVAAAVREASLALYHHASRHARARGLIIADTKFEFGLDDDGRLVLIDEVLTPDSSRFWPAEGWRVGISPPSFDKQYVRDYLETLDWNKRAPGPSLPPEVIARTAAKYAEALTRLTGPPLAG